ncbi:MAG TPA: AAA family ATPase, partial [Anaerolineales bacterium]|nr:AAA family ATPase [Anaerolineales bacterium]
MENLNGSIERITYYNSENGYSVLRLRPEESRPAGADRQGLVTIVGNLPELQPGEHVALQGHWLNHPKHGSQFQVEICEQTMPATVAGIRRYLGSGLIKGIGSRLADRIVAQFGDQTLDVIETDPERLLEVPDIGQKRARLIAAAWQDQQQVKQLMLFLHGHGVSTNLAVKIYKQYGEQSLVVVQTDPYRLSQDIFGVGFKTADHLAQALGLAADHPGRIEAGLEYALSEMSSNGHVYAPQGQLIERAAALLELEASKIMPAIDSLASQGRIQREVIPEGTDTRPQDPLGIRENHQEYGLPAIYLMPFYRGELGVAERLRALAAHWPTHLSDLPAAFLHLDTSLSAEQEEAVQRALRSPVSVLTGGPGTGKTTAVRALIEALETGHKTYALASPTGRAAKRLSQATGRPASTIHRLLGYSPGEGFKHQTGNPLPVDFVVVDETSMLDLLLANHLLKAIEPGTHLLLVGDVDQLPSVGAGDVLRDVIGSDIAPVTRLTTIFRQAAGSEIITNAHRINQGQFPLFSKESTDFFLFPAETPEEAGNWVQELVCERIPKKFGLRWEDEIQILSPMYRGAVGVTTLNERLQ